MRPSQQSNKEAGLLYKAGFRVGGRGVVALGKRGDATLYKNLGFLGVQKKGRQKRVSKSLGVSLNVPLTLGGTNTKANPAPILRILGGYGHYGAPELFKIKTQG